MSRVTLQASNAGIKRAREALKRLRLTQKELASDTPDRPPIAAWSTINGFFNGKAIDHLIFKEICHQLNLDWQDICEPAEVDSQPEVEPKPEATQVEGSILIAIQQQSIAAREALIPRILQPIARSVVKSRYIPAIARGVEAQQPRFIPIVGPAGYGKSTILGDIYDELVIGNTPWVGLILCSNLSSSIGYKSFVSYSIVASTFASMLAPDGQGATLSQEAVLETSLGQQLSGQSRSIVEITTDLTQQWGRGVLLIDTLDLIVSRDFVIAFSKLLRQLLSIGVTVVFTCRDREYADYFEPTQERLMGLSHAIDRYNVPNFTTAEIRAAVEAFFHKQDSNLLGQERLFADQILNLSADNRSLKSIIENPLLLALLCDLFAAEGNVPPDLTVSKLYQRYWQEKIAHTRKVRSDAQLLAMEKENLCLTIARRLFELSQERLCESIYRDELNIAFNEILIDAYNDLLSEGVLTLLPSRKFHFFHQTLLEYAIAYWLTRQSAQPQRQQLLATLNQQGSSLSHTHWFPVLRQLLTIADTETEFEQLISELNVRNLGIFGVISMAAASRDRPDALRNLLPTALVLGDAYQKRLRQAFEVASRQLIEQTWDVLLTLLETGTHLSAGNTAQLVGDLMHRWWDTLKGHLPEALEAIARRQPDSLAPGIISRGDWAMLSGWLLEHCLELMQQSPEPELLAALHPYLPKVGYRSFAAIIRLHIAPEVPCQTQYALLRRMVVDPLIDHDIMEQATCELVTCLLPPNPSVAPFPLGNSWSEILHNQLPYGWEMVQIKAVGRWAARDREVLEEILRDLMLGESHLLHRSLIALGESIQFGASEALFYSLTSLPAEGRSPANLKCFNALLTLWTNSLNPKFHEALTQWIKPLVLQQIDQFPLALDALADASPTARTLLEENLSQFSQNKQAQIRYQLLRFQPVEQHPPLKTFNKFAQRYLIGLYRKQAKTNAAARDRLLEGTRSTSKDVALTASQDIETICGDMLTIQGIMPMLTSLFPGVRVSGLIALKYRLEYSLSFTTDDLIQVCAHLSEEKNQTVARTFFNLINAWARKPCEVPLQALTLLKTIPPRLAALKLFEGGTARSLLDVLKAIAQTTHLKAHSDLLSQSTYYLLTTINLAQVRNGESETIDLLCAIHRLDPQFLSKFIQEDVEIIICSDWFWNISAVVKTIQRVEGDTSPLFQQILSANGCTPEIRNLILDMQSR